MSEPKLRYTIGERPAQAPEGWRIFNAPRPICGTVVCENGQWQGKTWIGPFVSGIIYAAVKPTDPDAPAWIATNREMDACELVYVTEQQAFDAALRWYQASEYAADIAEIDLTDEDHRRDMIDKGRKLLNDGEVTL